MIKSTAKIKRPQAAAWKTGSAVDFLKLSNEEAMQQRVFGAGEKLAA